MAKGLGYMSLEELEKALEEGRKVYYHSGEKKNYTIDLGKDKCWIRDDKLIVIFKTKMYSFDIEKLQLENCCLTKKPKTKREKKQRKEYFKKPQTICWDCANFSKCSWANGKPVDGWEATPTIIKNVSSVGLVSYTESFIVHSCPCYKDDMRRTSILELSRMLGRNQSSLGEKLRNKKGFEKVNEILEQMGYKLHLYKSTENKKQEYYLEVLE